jgi:glutathione S-transferase
MPLKLNWFPLSSPARSVKFFLATNNVEHESAVLDVLKGETKSEEYKKINARGEVPTIVDDGFVLSERYRTL